jgi:hypothetical protein
MSGASNRPRESLIRTAKHPSSNGALVTIQDSGPGLTSESFERLFD